MKLQLPFDLIAVKLNAVQIAKGNNENISHSPQTSEKKIGNNLSTANYANNLIITGFSVDFWELTDFLEQLWIKK